MIDLKARVLAAAAAEPSLNRTATARLRWIVLGGAALASLSVFALVGGVRISDRPVALLAATAAGAFAIAAAASVLAFRRGPSMLGRSAGVLVGIAIATPLLLLAWKVGMSSLFADMTRWWPERPGFRCMRLSAVLGAAPLAAMLFLWRGTAPARPRLTGLAIGAASGGLSWVLVDLWCPIGHVHHLLLGHALPLAAFAATGALGGALLAARGDRAKRAMQATRGR